MWGLAECIRTIERVIRRSGSVIRKSGEVIRRLVVVVAVETVFMPKKGAWGVGD